MGQPKRFSTKAKLEALKRGGIELPVDPRALALDMLPGEVPPPDERAVLILSSAYQYSEEPDYGAVSWSNQEKAADFFNKHGLIETLDEIVRVGGPDALSS